MRLSTLQERPEARLRSQPWRALSELHASLSAALRDVLSGSPAERALDALLRSLRSSDNDVRRALAEAVFGVGLWRRRLAWHAGIDEITDLANAADPRLLLFVLLRDLAGVPETDAAELSGLTGSPADSFPPRRPPPDAPGSWRILESFPDWLADHLDRELGAEAPLFARAINVPGPVTLRANTLVTPSADVLRTELESESVLTERTQHAPHGLLVRSPARPNILGLKAHQCGAFEVQDEGSQLLGALVDARPGETVLDFCAGAGGKMLQLAAAMQGQGVLHAWDPDSARLGRLTARLRKAHVDQRSIRVHRAEPPPPSLLVDKVLVDAPCSELGPLRRGPDLRWRLDPSTLQTLPATQRQILEQAARHVRPGGRLVYATCTLNRAENQDLACAFERDHPELERQTPGAPWLSADFLEDGFFVALPHRHGTDGFFAAVWTKRSA